MMIRQLLVFKFFPCWWNYILKKKLLIYLYIYEIDCKQLKYILDGLNQFQEYLKESCIEGKGMELFLHSFKFGNNEKLFWIVF